MPEIIRLGDSTSHGGKVIEGSPFDICMGKPIAYIGHKVQCPKCKGVFPIVEGAPTTTFYGKGVALAGMHTACGAVLIASQFTDVVEYDGGRAATNNASPSASSSTTSPAAAAASDAPSTKHDSAEDKFDERFVLQDADTGEPIAFAEYAIRRESGDIEYGTSDAHGCTHLLSATAKAEVIEIYV
ncbi:PAAR domain-containing protein [Massilia sp. 9I]|uniref:PAAR domain-containing protein n=1 Tax=Massilia sp. 9I TaxID=2653152 RepID=UPI0012F33015|nr:PAAR domain-containing protein [Massilia sp. 9I]VXC06879.1 Zn-binding Pro-Ala-Ala-Arg (PAAR) domain-containing protein, incolved in TypeVI secretion [Massilia sp. 9I]